MSGILVSVRRALANVLVYLILNLYFEGIGAATWKHLIKD